MYNNRWLDVEEDYWENVWSQGLWDSGKQVPVDHWGKEDYEQEQVRVELKVPSW